MDYYGRVMIYALPRSYLHSVNKQKKKNYKMLPQSHNEQKGCSVTDLVGLDQDDKK